MDEFLKVIKRIDWDMLHDQKAELLQLMDDQERVLGRTGQLEGLVNLLDELQDTAAKLKIWTFPSERYNGNCPECGGKNYEFLEEKDYALKHECHDCGVLFSITKNGKVHIFYEGTEGQDREGYSDDQDRDNYTPIELEDGGL